MDEQRPELRWDRRKESHNNDMHIDCSDGKSLATSSPASPNSATRPTCTTWTSTTSYPSSSSVLMPAPFRQLERTSGRSAAPPWVIRSAPSYPAVPSSPPRSPGSEPTATSSAVTSKTHGSGYDGTQAIAPSWSTATTTIKTRWSSLCGRTHQRIPRLQCQFQHQGGPAQDASRTVALPQHDVRRKPSTTTQRLLQSQTPHPEVHLSTSSHKTTTSSSPATVKRHGLPRGPLVSQRGNKNNQRAEFTFSDSSRSGTGHLFLFWFSFSVSFSVGMFFR